MAIIDTFLELVWSFLAIFLFCEFGGMVTNRFDEFHDELWQFNWYSFPIEMQKAFLIFMVNVHKPATIEGYANILCTRELFKQVIDFCKQKIIKHFDFRLNLMLLCFYSSFRQ